MGESATRIKEHGNGYGALSILDPLETILVPYTTPGPISFHSSWTYFLRVAVAFVAEFKKFGGYFIIVAKPHIDSSFYDPYGKSSSRRIKAAFPDRGPFVLRNERMKRLFTDIFVPLADRGDARDSLVFSALLLRVGFRANLGHRAHDVDVLSRSERVLGRGPIGQ